MLDTARLEKVRHRLASEDAAWAAPASVPNDETIGIGSL